MSLTDIQSKHIQVLRGIAIVAVVFIHNTPIGLPQVFIRPFLNFCVGMFLFLSGFLSSNKSWKPKKRILKVLVPYAIWTFIYVCASNLSSLSEIPFDYLKSFLLGDSAAIMYYIFIYCQFTLLIPIIEKLANSKYKYLGFIISPIEIILMRSLPLILGYEINIYLEKIIGLSCLGWFTYFYLGYLIGNKKIIVNYRKNVLISLLIITILAQFLEGYYYYSLGEVNCGSQLKISTLFSGAIFALLGYNYINSEKLRNYKSLHVLGDYSFGIYFSHLAVMSVFSFVPYYSKYVIYPFNAIFTIIVSLVLCYIGKKILKKYSWLIAL